jgi:hypothetical protein
MGDADQFPAPLGSAGPASLEPEDQTSEHLVEKPSPPPPRASLASTAYNER